MVLELCPSSIHLLRILLTYKLTSTTLPKVCVGHRELRKGYRSRLRREASRDVAEPRSSLPVPSNSKASLTAGAKRDVHQDQPAGRTNPAMGKAIGIQRAPVTLEHFLPPLSSVVDTRSHEAGIQVGQGSTPGDCQFDPHAILHSTRAGGTL